MTGRRRQAVVPLTDEERQLLETQTRRNLDAIEYEAAGRPELALPLYEQNVAEGFPGDWPYSRLASAYERAGQYDDAVRVLTRAIEVTRADRRRPAADRRAVVQGLQGRLRTVRKTLKASRAGGSRAAASGRSFILLPVVD